MLWNGVFFFFFFFFFVLCFFVVVLFFLLIFLFFFFCLFVCLFVLFFYFVVGFFYLFFFFVFVFFFFFFFFFFCCCCFSVCELNISSGSGCFVVEAFELEVFLYLVIYFGYVLVRSISCTCKGKKCITLGKAISGNCRYSVTLRVAEGVVKRNNSRYMWTGPHSLQLVYWNENRETGPICHSGYKHSSLHVLHVTQGISTRLLQALYVSQGTSTNPYIPCL